MAQQDILDRLSDAQRYGNLSVDLDHLVVDAYKEIMRLRASQFRWIPVGEKPISGEQCLISFDGKHGQYVSLLRAGELNPSETWATHWAPIPPLPEKSQGEKDEELWAKYDDVHACDTAHKEFRIRQAFLAGLRAAREQKP